MRTDPTDTGGLFVRRRPGTAPVRYREEPPAGTPARRQADRALAGGVLAAMIVVNLLFWGPLPALSLWIASRVQYATDSVSAGLLAGFVALLVVLFGGLVALKRLDGLWILMRRAGGVDQRTGVMPRVFGATAIVAAIGFTLWLVLIGGLGSMAMPGR